jgi:hypothetical protein
MMFAGISQLEELTARSRSALTCASVGLVSLKITALLRVYRRIRQDATLTILSFYKTAGIKELPVKTPSFVLKFSKCKNHANTLSRPIPGGPLLSIGGIADAFAEV